MSTAQWRSSTWFIVTAMAAALFTDTFLSLFVVPILPYMLEDRMGLDPSRTQSMISWLLAANSAITVIVRIPLAHFADQSESTRGWFLWALGIALLSTVGTAVGSSLPVLFISRSVQTIASSIMWVVGFTTVANTVSLENTAKTYAMISMAVSLGASTGPMLAGMLFQLAGYWAAWSIAFVVLGIDMTFRLLMVEKTREKEDTIGDSITNPVSERSPLLSTHPEQPEAYVTPETRPNFYRCIFSMPNFVAGTYCNFMYGILLTSFNATVPLHVRDVFGWGGMESGLMFAALQIPRLMMSPFVGWLKDRVGTKVPTAFGFALLAPLMWLVGVPGSVQDSPIGNRGPALYVATMILIGFSMTFLNGLGSIEATVAATELGRKYPGAFGPNGGKARAIAIVGIAWVLGTCVGPLLSGKLNERFGYYVMNCVMAGLCALTTPVAFIYLPSRLTPAEVRKIHQTSTEQ